MIDLRHVDLSVAIADELKRRLASILRDVANELDNRQREWPNQDDKFDDEPI
jgi:hypothetical protein